MIQSWSLDDDIYAEKNIKTKILVWKMEFKVSKVVQIPSYKYIIPSMMAILLDNFMQKEI